MLRLAGLLLLTLPLLAQLPAGVARFSFPEGSPWEPKNLVATGDGTLWAGMGVDSTVIGFGPDGATRRIDLPDWLIQDMTAASDGRVWIGTRNSLARLDPATNRVRRWLEFPHVTRVLAGPDGNTWFVQGVSEMDRLWYPLLTRFSPESGVLATYRVDGLRGLVFGSDGALWMSFADGAACRLVRMTAAGERTEYPLEHADQLFAGPGFLWTAFPDRVVRLNLRGEVIGTYHVAMAPVAADPIGNLWFRARTAAGEELAQLTPGGVLTRFAPLPAYQINDCSEALHGGFAILPDGRVAMTDYRSEFHSWPWDTCRDNTLRSDRTLTILDPAIAPVASVEQLNPAPRRRLVRR